MEQVERTQARTHENLLPCPFCGCTEIEIHTAGKPFYFAVCTNPDCETEGPIDLGESGAIEKWNTRKGGETTIIEPERIQDAVNNWSFGTAANK